MASGEHALNILRNTLSRSCHATLLKTMEGSQTLYRKRDQRHRRKGNTVTIHPSLAGYSITSDLLKSHKYLHRKSTHKSIVNFVNKVRYIPVRTTKAMVQFQGEKGGGGRRKKREDRWSSVSRRPEKEEEGQLGWW
ncbi:hypothetical protein ANTRET_LOCUS6397 [Anthophora retusa]